LAKTIGAAGVAVEAVDGEDVAVFFTEQGF
jgi:hypothetical protein